MSGRQYDDDINFDFEQGNLFHELSITNLFHDYGKGIKQESEIKIFAGMCKIIPLNHIFPRFVFK